MLPITRANLQSFCRNCLREFTASETTHEIEQTVVQRNRLFPQKICHCCYIKIKTLKVFQDRANLATGVLKLIVEERFSEKHDKMEIETLKHRLKSFCRLCLKTDTKSIDICTDAHISNDIIDCTGLLIEAVPIKTEKNSYPLSDDIRYPHTICSRCQNTLKRFVEYRKIAKQTINYLQSILDDEDNEGDFADENDINLFRQTTEVENIELPSLRFDTEFVIENESICEELSEHNEDNKPKRNFKKHTTRNYNESNEKCNLLENIFVKEDKDELHKEQKFPNAESESSMPLDFLKEIQAEAADDNVPLREMLLKSETPDEFIKTESYNLEEGVDNFFNAIEHNASETNLIKQENDSYLDEHYGDNDNDGHIESTSDTSSDDICLAKLIATNKGKLKKPQKRLKTSTNSKSNKQQKRITNLTGKQEKAKYTCEKCNKSFFKQHTIEAHLKSHEGASKAFACKQCESSFTTFQALQRHSDVHDPKAATTILKSRRQRSSMRYMRYKSTRKCPNCNLVFKRHIDLAEHIRKQHNGVYVFKCKICGKCLSTQAVLNRHEQNHSDERPFACKFCEKRYNYESELKVHMQRHTADPALLCPICKIAKPNPEELQKHIASHRKPHQCSKCGKVFTKAYTLHQHELAVHLNLKVHKCQQCDLSFKGRKTLTLHILHHDPMGRPESCRVCGLHFRTKRGRLRHTSKFHPNVQLPPEEPSTTSIDDGRTEYCEKCPLCFKTKRGLMLHTKKTHEKGQRVSKTEDELKEKYGAPEICEICQLQCFSKKGLSRHIRKSHPELAEAKDQQKTANCSEKCVLCPLKFRTARGLLLHTKRMHRDTSSSNKLKNFGTVDNEEQKISLPLNWL